MNEFKTCECGEATYSNKCSLCYADEGLLKPKKQHRKPFEHEYTSQVAYTRALEAYCDSLAQRTWVGLTPQERDEINEQVYGAAPHHVAFHHAIEAKLKDKNSGL